MTRRTIFFDPSLEIWIEQDIETGFWNFRLEFEGINTGLDNPKQEQLCLLFETEYTNGMDALRVAVEAAAKLNINYSSRLHIHVMHDFDEPCLLKTIDVNELNKLGEKLFDFENMVIHNHVEDEYDNEDEDVIEVNPPKKEKASKVGRPKKDPVLKKEDKKD